MAKETNKKSCQTDGENVEWGYNELDFLPGERMTKIFYDFYGSADSEQKIFSMTKVQLADWGKLIED